MSALAVPDRPMPVVRGPLRLALALVIAFFLGFGGWAAFAPLTSAAVAPGTVSVEAKRKTVQHLDGGIIAALEVREGDKVAAGDLLIRLDDTMAQSTYDLLEGQYIDLIAEQARLEAERARRVAIAVPPILAEVRNQARAEEALTVQRNLFESRRTALENRIAILESRKGKLEEQIRGYEAQAEAADRQRAIIARETEAVERMVRQGLEREPRLLALQRTMAEIEGFLGKTASNIAQAEVRIGEADLEVLDLESRTVNQVTGDLRDLAGRIADMAPRLRAAEATLRRTEIRAPVSGTIVGLQYHTVGGVISPGGRVLDIVPEDAELLVEARVSPADIDIVRPGMIAEVRLSVYAARTTPTVPGTVVHVSADRMTDQGTQEHYYDVHVRLDPGAAAAADYPATIGQLYPGMPVEVMIVTGEDTLLNYLLRPLIDSFARAFRES